MSEDVASRVEKLLGPPIIGNRIRELINENLDHEKIAFKIAEEIALVKYGQETIQERADQGDQEGDPDHAVHRREFQPGHWRFFLRYSRAADRERSGRPPGQ